ncbi:MAG TPA: M13 family metallopeptidase [Gemmatimonadales bacterium]|nr:M13 family metallopeptidase [Gemmatimonadales bacterium]
MPCPGFRTRRLLLALAVCFTPAAPLAAQQSIPGLDAAGMDRSVKPGDDFYAYANGAWARTTEIPADRAAISGFSAAGKKADEALSSIVHGAVSADAPAGTDTRRIGDFYRAYLDTAAIEQAGLTPLRPVLAAIEAIGDRAALARYLGSTLRADLDVINDGALYTENPFGLWVDEDFDDPAKNFAAVMQGGLGMPDRRYYLDSSAAMQETRTAYRRHVAAILALAGIGDTAARADAIMALETEIARVHWPREDSWDVLKGNNHWTRSDFAGKAPGLDWEAFFDAAGMKDITTFVAWQPSAITGISALLASEPLESWKSLLAFHAIEHHAAVLPAAFRREGFAFNGAVLSGVKQAAPRERQALNATSAALGFAVGKLYAERYFPAALKRRAETMVAGIIHAFDLRIDRLAWMAPATKVAAKAKLKTLRVSVGYPDSWPTYDGYEVSATDAFGNQDRLERLEYAEHMRRLRRPSDRTEWSMTPQQVNAVNMPAMNAMNFPAAIFQPPFFDGTRPDAMNYAAIGAVIGHEISHSFDNLGAGFDAAGRLRNWWTADDLAHFNASADQLVRQYDGYRPFPDLAVNGRLTLSENMADLAGITAAYDAWRASLRGKPAPRVAGLTGDQQFFLSFEQMWRSKFRDAALRQTVLTNGHAPGMYRALTVRNLDAWYQAFQVAPGDSLYLAPGERVRIW